MFGPTLWVNIGNINKIPALIDSGARISCIDIDLAGRLSLQPVDIRPTAGVHGEQDTEFFLVEIHVPVLEFTESGLLAGLPLQGSGFYHTVLLGRDFLQSVHMAYGGHSGTVTVSTDYPVPS